MRAGAADAAGARGTRDFLRLSGLALATAILATLAAHALHWLIATITQLAFYGEWSAEWVSPAGHTRGAWVILIPVLGGGVIALLARFGTRAIIGHGIPEVMQQVLANRSRIAPKVALLKPLSSAVSIGTGGPYGAEGPVIATGGALGSLLGQALTMTASERKILLAAGAAAAMTALFGSPVAATLLAVELLLFELRIRSVVPVAIAAAAAQAMRHAWGEGEAIFQLADAVIGEGATASSVPVLVVIGALGGGLAVAVNAAVHGVEDVFARLRISPLWGPLIGGLFVGLVGWLEPRIFGAGYDVITGLLGGGLTVPAVALVCGLKLVAWVMSLGSGTSGGTLAPMLIVGGGLGSLAAAGASWLGLPALPAGLAALAGMIAFFAGGSRALFASVVLAVEITGRAEALWPAATAATVALAVAHLLSPRSLMTSPVERGGVRVPTEFAPDVFAQVTVGQVMEPAPRTISGAMNVGELADRIGAHEPEVCHHPALLVTDADGGLSGIITRRDLLAAVERGEAAERVDAVMSRNPVCAWPDEFLHEAIDRMHVHDVGRLLVVDRADPRRLLGYLGRAAVLSARRARWRDHNEAEPGWFGRRS